MAYERLFTVTTHVPCASVPITVTDSQRSSPIFHCTEFPRAHRNLGRGPNTALEGAVRRAATRFAGSDNLCERRRTPSMAGSGSACSPATIPSSNFFRLFGSPARAVQPTSTCNANRPEIGAQVGEGEPATAHQTLSTSQTRGKSKVIVWPSRGRGGGRVGVYA